MREEKGMDQGTDANTLANATEPSATPVPSATFGPMQLDPMQLTYLHDPNARR